MKLIVGKTPVTLDKSDVIGDGGEAVIFQLGRRAIKVYRDPNTQRARKLRDFMQAAFKLPDNVVAPLEPVFDIKDRLVGFAMRCLPSTHHPIAMLCSRDFCTRHNFNTKQIIDVFVGMHRTLTAIHKQGLIVGDLNDQNEDFDSSGQDFWLDVDSWQFNQYPCMVGTEAYLSPELYGVDLSIKPVFKEEYDWYSFCVLLFRSLLRVHPFRCIHPKYKSLMACAQHGITVLDKDVDYPRVGLPPAILNDELIEVLLNTLKRKNRGQIPFDQLMHYHDILIQCKSCGIWYPHTRSQCPGCAEKTIVDQRLAVQVADLICEDFIVTQGKIIFFETIGDAVYCLADENGQAVMYKKSGNRSSVRRELFTISPGARYGIFNDMLVACQDPFAEKPDLFVVDFSGGDPKGFASTATEKLAGSSAVFACSGEYLYRIAGNMVVRSEQFGENLIDREVIQALPGQTWFTSSRNINDFEMLLGFYRIFGVYQWFLVTSKGNIFTRFDDLKLQPLDSGESMIDMSIKFSSTAALIMRKTRQRGVDFVRIDAVNGLDGKIVQSYVVKVADAPEVYDNIHGRAFAGGLILHPTDHGVIRENVSNHQRDEISGIRQFVKADDAVHIFKSDLLVVTDNKIMRLKKK